MFNFFFIFFCGNYRVMLMSFLLVLFFAVDQALRDQFIFVGDLAGCLSCSFLQVCKHWIWHKIPSHHSLQNWQHLFPWLQWAVYSGWPHAVFSQSSGHFSLLYLVWPVYGFEILCITSNALMVFSVTTATVLHASFRTPNLKARLNTFREEFRAVWRNYSEL
jgi:hypothetical protein